jgi:glutaredoxin 3
VATSVVVYSTDTCPWCERTKEFLRSHNVPFVDKNVAQDRMAAVEMVRRSGQQGVPVVATEDEVIVGFDQVRLGRIAKQFAAPKRPPFGVMAANVSDYFASHPEAASAAPGVTSGVYVGKVRPGTVAASAGLQPGDVIVGFAGKRVRNLPGLDKLVESVSAGDEVSVTFYRSGSEERRQLQF